MTNFSPIRKPKTPKVDPLIILKFSFAMIKLSNVILTFLKFALITKKLETIYVGIAEES